MSRMLFGALFSLTLSLFSWAVIAAEIEKVPFSSEELVLLSKLNSGGSVSERISRPEETISNLSHNSNNTIQSVFVSPSESEFKILTKYTIQDLEMIVAGEASDALLFLVAIITVTFVYVGSGGFA